VDQVLIPSPEQLRDKAAEIVAGPDYRLNQGTSDSGWMLALILEILEWILAPFFWLFRLTEGLPDFLRWLIVFGCAVILILLIVHIVYTFVSAIRGEKRIRDPGFGARRTTIDPHEFERLAREAGTRGDYITAVRFLFRASILRLELAEKKANRPGMTNRELIRRYRDRPKLLASLMQFVEMIDRKWYGDESCSVADYSSCEAAHGDICLAIEEFDHALGA
jgi:hypothetical protein